MVGEEVPDGVVPCESAALIKGDGQRTVPGTRLKLSELAAEQAGHIFDQHSAISLALKGFRNRQVLNFQQTLSFIGHNTYALNDSVILKHKHPAAVQIAVDHILLLICKQQEREIVSFVFGDFPDHYFVCSFVFVHC